MRLRAETGRGPRSRRGDLRTSMWRWASHLTVTVGLLCALARWGWAEPLAAVLILSSCAVFVASAVLADRGVSGLPQVLRISVWSGVTLTAVGGLLAVFRLAGVLVLMLVVGLSPLLRMCLESRWFTGTGVPGRLLPDATRSATRHAEPGGPLIVEEMSPLLDPGAPRSQEPPQDPAGLDDAALCLAWRRSFAALQAARTASEHGAVAAQRRLYLDELQRRHPRGVAAWLASGARAASNPMPFLDEERRRDA